MSDITICVATQEECKKKCKRRHITPNPYSQSYANFSLDYKKGNKCEACIGYGLKASKKKLTIN